jgi:lipoate-protein ligase A
MFCRLIIDQPAPGAWNMAVDETLLETATDEGGFTLRFYRWQQPTLSLGYFQQYDDRLKHNASHDCAAVRRQTGGGAILHDREITYSFIVPPGHQLAIKHITLYETIHNTLIDVLADYGIHASLCRNAGRENAQNQPFLCFQRRSPGDVLVSDIKIAGSAQRRFKGAVLQHGSVLLARSPAAPELRGIAETAAILLSFNQMAQAWSSMLGKKLSLHLESAVLTDSQQRHASELARKKYDSADWTRRRTRVICIETK